MRLFHAFGRRNSHAPPIDPSGRPFPVVGAPFRIAVVDLLDVARVFDDHVFRAQEVREHIVAGAVAADTPFDGMAVITHTPGAPHDRIKIRHFIGNVMQRGAVTMDECDTVMIGIAADKIHHPGPVRHLEAQHINKKLRGLIGARRIEYRMRKLAGPIGDILGGGVGLHIGKDSENSSLVVLETKSISAAGFRDRSGFIDRSDAEPLGLCVKPVYRRLVRRHQVHAQKLYPRARMQREDMVFRAGAAQINRSVLFRDLFERPDIGIELGVRLHIGNAEINASERHYLWFRHRFTPCIAAKSLSRPNRPYWLN